MCNVAIRLESPGGRYQVSLSSLNRNIQFFFFFFFLGHFLNPLVSVRTIQKKKTPNGDKVDIVTSCFYKNIIFTSLSDTSLLGLYSVQGNDKRNDRVCFRHTTLATKASVKQKNNMFLTSLGTFHHFCTPVLSPCLCFIFLGEMCGTFILPC